MIFGYRARRPNRWSSTTVAKSCVATAEWNTKFEGVLGDKPVRLHYWPAYSNPYQALLYGLRTADFSAYPNPIEVALKELEGPREYRTVFHLHWLNFLLDSSSPRKTKQVVEQFSEKLRRFSESGGVLLWTVHKMSEHDLNEGRIEQELRREIARLSHAIFVHGKAAKTELTAAYPDAIGKTHVIPHGSYIGVYPDEISRESARTGMKIAADSTVFLNLGMIRRYKGLDALSLAVESLPATQPETKLVVAGHIRDRDKHDLKELTQIFHSNSRTIFVQGRVPDNEIQKYMNLADYVVLPYLKSLTSGAAILALSFGVPVIAPNKGPFPELVLDGETGYIYDHNVPGALAEALERARSTSKELRARMRFRSFEIANEMTWSRARLEIFDSIRSV